MIIKHSRGSYEIKPYPLTALLQDLPSEAFVLTDAHVMPLVENGLADLPTLVLEPGEGNKTLDVYARCLSWLAQNRASRKATLVALGGGVIGDLGGFVAATYMRGIRFIQIPTTLLAQVDSSVGGKVGVDMAEGKNLVGAFHAPAEVRLCLEILRNLPPRQFANGMAEVWKYGAIQDAALFDDLSANVLTPQDPRLSTIVQRCIALKAEVVEADEFETTGLRAILNFGHTIGHAIESLTGYGPVLHGEAIAIGMLLEARLGARLGITPPDAEARLRTAFRATGLPIEHPITRDSESMIAAMRKDKKASRQGLAFSLLTRIGECKLVEGVDEREVRATLESA